jgi:hypothetical protein
MKFLTNVGGFWCWKVGNYFEGGGLRTPSRDVAVRQSAKVKEDSTFFVYTKPEIDDRFTKQTALITNTLRSEVRDSVVSALRELDSRLFTRDVQDRLTNTVVSRVEVVLRAQEERIRTELLAEIDRRLGSTQEKR